MCAVQNFFPHLQVSSRIPSLCLHVSHREGGIMNAHSIVCCEKKSNLLPLSTVMAAIVASSFWSSINKSTDITLTPKIISQIRTPEFDEVSLISPTGRSAKLATYPATLLQTFLELHFGNPPKTPTLKLEFSPTDILLYVEDNKSQIAGMIRYSYAGHLDTTSINVVDCFCIAPVWRKLGLGTYLLTMLHQETMRRGLQFSIFLKESAPIFALKRPFYSSSYVYTRTHRRESNVQHLVSHRLALSLVDNYLKIYPDTFTVVKRTGKPTIWRLWHHSPYSILASFHNSFQIHPETNSPIGWCTGWLESSTQAPASIRNEAISAMMDSLPFDWVWADKAWIGSAMADPRWSIDGPFHWYSYQWTPTCPPHGSYILHV